MGFTWRQKRDALKEAVAWALRVDTLAPPVQLADGTASSSHLVAWQGERGFSRWTSGLWCDLRLNWVTPRGKDEHRQNYDATNDVISYEYGGTRHFVVTVVIGSSDQQDTDAVGTLAQNLRVRMRSRYVNDLLGAVDIGLANIHRTIFQDYDAHGVKYSASVTDIAFNTVETFVEDVPEAGVADGGYVNQVELHGDFPSADDPQLTLDFTVVGPTTP